MELICIIVGGVIVYLHLVYKKIKKNKKNNQTPYREDLETKIHLFNYGIDGKDDVENITFKNLEIIKHKGKVYEIAFIFFPNEPVKVIQENFETIKPLRDLSSFPRKIYNVDVNIQEMLHKAKIWAITGELKYVNDQIIFSGIALREENDDDDDSDKGREGELTPIQPELVRVLV